MLLEFVIYKNCWITESKNSLKKPELFVFSLISSLQAFEAFPCMNEEILVSSFYSHSYCNTAA